MARRNRRPLEPYDCPTCGKVHERGCHGHRKTGDPCQKARKQGATACVNHLPNPKARAMAAIRAEVQGWGLGSADVDPGEILLRMVSQSAARAERYAGMLEDAYDAAEQLRAAHDAGELLIAGENSTGDDKAEAPAVQTARDTLDRIFTTGGVAALIGHTYAATNNGQVYATGEAIRGLAKLEADERDRCASFAAKAVAAGLAERQVKLAERHGALIADVLRAVFDDPDLGLTQEQRRAVPGVSRRHLTAISS